MHSQRALETVLTFPVIDYIPFTLIDLLTTFDSPVRVCILSTTSKNLQTYYTL